MRWLVLALIAVPVCGVLVFVSWCEYRMRRQPRPYSEMYE